jgi:predicted transcriptional regulator of viral defense system
MWRNTNKEAVIAGINYYVNSGQLYRIRRGIYAKDASYDKTELACRIYTPAYVSFETVLTRAGINFQYYGQIFVASYLARKIVVDGQVYQFRKIKNALLTDSAGIINKDGIAIATSERAFLDTLYLNTDYHFDNLASLDWDNVFEMLPLYDNKRMKRKVEEFFKDKG